MSLFALGALTIPFFGSLSPTNQSVENAEQLGFTVDLDEIAPGTFIEKGSEYNRYFVLRDFDGEVHLFTVPHRRKMYWIAEFYWSQPVMPCERFGPDAVGKDLIEGGMIRCHDPDMSDWFRRESVWDYSGKNMGERTEDMPEAQFEINGSLLVIKDTFWPLDDVSSDDA